MSGFYSYYFNIMDKTLVVAYTPQEGDTQKPRVIAKNVKGYEDARVKAKKHFDKAARMFEIRGEAAPQVFLPIKVDILKPACKMAGICNQDQAVGNE